MVDVLFRPEGLKSWPALKKDLPLDPGLISGHAHSSPFNLTRSALDEIFAQHACLSIPDLQSKPKSISKPQTSQSRGPRSFRVRKDPAIKHKRTKSNQKITADSIVPQDSFPMIYHSGTEPSLFRTENIKCPKSTSALHPARSFPGMYTMSFENGKMEFQQNKRIEDPEPVCTSSSVDSSSTLINPMPLLDMGWPDQTSSFLSRNNDTPSLVSSFGMVDTPNEEMPIYHGLPSLSTSIPSHKNDVMVPQQVQPSPLHNLSNGVLWSSWQPDNVELWRQQFVSQGPAWSIPEELYNGWQNSENIPSPTFVPAYPMQAYAPFPTITPAPFINQPQASYMPFMPFTGGLTQINPNQHQHQKIPKSPPTNFDQAISLSASHQQTTAYQAPAPAPITTTPSLSSPGLSHTTGLSNAQSQGWITDHGTPTSSHKSLSSPDSTLRPNLKLTTHLGNARNTFLIDCKRQGLSYKDIKRLGGFKEAESTLRGRYRTLTKSKEQRVRKPKWSDTDIKLLCEGVSLYAEKSFGHYVSTTSTTTTSTTPPTSSMTTAQVGKHDLKHGIQAQLCQPPKVPWKKVAQYIWSHGGSYQFGNATCKKKWCEIHGIKL